MGQASDRDPPVGDAELDALDHELTHARPTTIEALPLARTKVAAALFGTSDDAAVGRFRILERLGAGGMGVVYAAYDPELKRAVALKLVKVPEGQPAEAALAEARALARLSHPHVVPIHDVGLQDGQVFIVMELVRGETLRRWSIGRSLAEIVRMYRQAGLALEAAHQAGLIHRDFKPDNVLVGVDRRVRVVDFGLACEARTSQVGLGGGTPRYMAPEQARGDPLTPAADQFGFCRSLSESLQQDDGRPLPRWLRLVLEQGMAPDPRARFSSMRALLRALAQDPARRRRLVAAGGVGLSAAALLFVAGRSSRDVEDRTCGGGERLLAETWSPDRQHQALARLQRLGAFARSLPDQLERPLAEWRRQWAQGHHDACSAHRRGAHSAEMLDRRMICLDRARSALVKVAELAESAEPATVTQLPLAVTALPLPATCSDLQALNGARPAPGPELRDLYRFISQARIEVAAGRYRQAAERAGAAAARARAAGDRPTLAEALLVQGHAVMAMDRRLDSVPALSEAARIGFEMGSYPLAIEAWARRAWAQGTAEASASALAGLEIVEAIARERPNTRFARALLHNNVGSVELALARPDRARAAFSRALDESRGFTGPGAVELTNVRVNLALVSPPAQRDLLLEQTEQQLVSLLGEAHPHTLEVMWIRAVRQPSLSRAQALLARICERFDQHPGLSTKAVRCWSELAFVRGDQGDDAGAVAALERAWRRGTRRLVEYPEVEGYLSLRSGHPALAARLFSQALDREATGVNHGDALPWHRLRTAGLNLGLGQALSAAGRFSAARRPLEQAVASMTDLARGRDIATLPRRLARAQAELALVRNRLQPIARSRR